MVEAPGVNMLMVQNDHIVHKKWHSVNGTLNFKETAKYLVVINSLFWVPHNGEIFKASPIVCCRINDPLGTVSSALNCVPIPKSDNV